MNAALLVSEIIAGWALLSLFLIYATWVHFAAIMRMRALRDTGGVKREEDRVLWLCGMLVLFVGLVLDVAVQLIVISPAMLELPVVRTPEGWKIEWLTTSRLIRWNRTKSTSWWTRNVRKPIVDLGKVLLDKVDTDGLHIR